MWLQGVDEPEAAIHLELTFPAEYPKKPPSAAFLTHIPYFDGATETDAQGRQTICLSVLGDFATYHTEWGDAGEAQGWSSAYTVSTLLSVVSVMIADQFERAKTQRCYGGVDAASARAKARSFVCPLSGHNGRARATWLPALPAPAAPSSPPASEAGDPTAASPEAAAEDAAEGSLASGKFASTPPMLMICRSSLTDCFGRSADRGPGLPDCPAAPHAG